MIRYYYDWIAHRVYLARFCGRFIIALIKRVIKHDLSKLSRLESEALIKTIPRLRESTYGSDEYQNLLDEIKPALDHHYKENRHHPEHFYCYAEMNLVDLVEMFFDWWAATKKHKDGNMLKSIEHNQERFEISEDVSRIFRNTYRGL